MIKRYGTGVKTVKNMLVYLLVCILLGTLLMVLVYSLPTGRMSENVRASREILDSMVVSDYSFYSWAPGIPYATMDGVTDPRMLNIAIYDGTGSIVHDAMMNPRIVYDNKAVSPKNRETIGLLKILNGETLEKSNLVNYARYWHGYLVFLKPLLLVVGVSGIRVINFILQFILTMMVIIRIYEKLGKPYAYAFALTILSINPISTALCLQLSDIYYIVLLTLLFMLSKNDWLKLAGRYHYLFMFNGICTAYFDFLTYPVVSLGIPVIVYLLLNRDMTATNRAISVAAFGFSWGLGYFGMWAGKWIMAYILTGQNVISDAINSIGHWTSEATIPGDGGALRWWPIFERLFSNDVSMAHSSIRMMTAVRVSVILLCLLVVAFFSTLVYLALKRRISICDILPFLLVCLYPLLWCFVVQGHTIYHYSYTFRIFSVMFFAMLCIAIQCRQSIMRR